MVCKCLTRTAARVLLESQDLIKNGTINESGLLDLLFQAASHPSAHVCGLAVEALTTATAANKGMAARLLPVLQGKAVVPCGPAGDADGVGADDHADFRDRVLADALVACHEVYGASYLESCGVAVEEFCQAGADPSSPHLPFQLEAALFCMVTVAERASSKEAEAQVLRDQLEKIVCALARNSLATTSHPLVTARMCQFIKKVNRFGRCFLSNNNPDIVVYWSFSFSISPTCPSMQHPYHLAQEHHRMKACLRWCQNLYLQYLIEASMSTANMNSWLQALGHDLYQKHHMH